MSFFSIINLLGGLALFLFGMTVLSSSLEKASEGRLEKVLERLTDNLPKAVLFGALVTGAIQSSSATTVVVVGLVNAKVIRLRQAIGIIMGANIGTTVTAHILRLTDITSDNFLLNLIKPSTLAPLAAAIGIVLYLAGRSDKLKEAGHMLLGFGVLFGGMFQMEAAMKPLAALPGFAALFAGMSNPVFGVLVGAGVTALIQSSSASIGILQALSSTGSITCATAFPIILGQNIGTCITPILASLGASKGAKRAAFVHLCFNVIGTALFLSGLYALQAVIGFPFWNDPITKGGIANFHTIFNVLTTLLFMPFARLLEKLAERVIAMDASENQLADAIGGLDDRLLVSPGLAIEHGRDAVFHMADLAMENFQLAKAMITGTIDPKAADRLHQNESNLDRLQDKVEDYAIKISRRHITERNKNEVSELLHMISELERIGDQCENMMDAAMARPAPFSDEGQREITHICNAVQDILELSLNAYRLGDHKLAHRVEPLEQVIDILEEQFKNGHIARMRDGSCTVDAGFAFVEAISCLERIADHCSNVAVFLITFQEKHDDFDTHAYLHALHKGESPEYTRFYQEYEQKYLVK
ncbi:MAG: Na/Pi cotransporter family protein [Angelakisella sp.]